MTTIFRVLLFTALASVAAIQTVAAANGDWPQLGFNAHGRRENPNETILSRETVPHLVLKWSVDLNVFASSPAVANGLVYVGSFDGHLFARDAATGAAVWSAATPDYIESSPAVADGAVYIDSVEGRLYSFDAETGAPRWSAIIGTPPGGQSPSSPTVAGDTVFVVSDRTVFALNARNGIARWHSTNPIGEGQVLAPTVANGLVYVAWDDKLIAYDVRSGAQRWSADLGGNFTPVGAPAVDKGSLYVVANVSLYAFDAKTGNKIWRSDTGSWQPSIAVADGHIFRGTADRILWSYDRGNGQLTYGQLTASAIQTTPAIANGVLYAGSYTSTIGAYNTRTGALLWALPTASTVMAAPTVSNGMLYVSGRKLYAYGLDGG